MKKLPQQVTVGPMVYTVTEDTSRATDGVYGSILYADSRISLQPGLAQPFQEIILWHEMIHAVLSQSGLRDQDEQVIHAIAYGVVEILRDNPELVK